MAQNKNKQDEEAKEEEAIVLDFLSNGYPQDDRPDYKKKPIVQALGKEYFTLLELVPKEGVSLQPHDRVYIGDGKREEIHYIKGRLSPDKLTGTARSELEPILAELVEEDEERFVDFFNNAQPLTTRMHQLELLPGLGKKHMWAIIEERKAEEFENFEDIKERVKLMPDPKETIVERILSEIQGEEKHNIFVKN